MECILKEIEVISQSQQIEELTEENCFLRALIGELRLKVYGLEKENEQLKSNQEKLVEENIELEVSNEVLHNETEVGSYDKTLFEGNNPNDEYDEGLLAFAYTMAENDFKFGGHDLKTN